jgi:hypothetical protein
MQPSIFSILRGRNPRIHLSIILFFVSLSFVHPTGARGQSEEANPSDQNGTGTTKASNPPVKQTSATPTPPELPEDSVSWGPPFKDGSGWDWVLLTSGELLKGTIERIRNDEMEFDSDKLDMLQMDMEDVAEFHASRIHTYLFEGRITVTGRGILRGDELIVDGQKFKRETLMGIIKGKEEERNYWSGQLNLGLSLLIGNTEQATFTSSGYIRRESAKSRLSLQHNLTFGSIEGDVNVQNITGAAEYDIYLSKRWYITPAWLVTTHDRFQNIDVRVIPGAGAGVQVFKTSTVEWDIEAGLGYQYEKFREVVPGEDQVGHDGVVRVSTWMDVDFGSMVDMEFLWWTIFNYTEWGRTSHHGSLMFEFEITDIFDLTISAIYDRVEQPESYEVQDDSTDPPTTEVVTPKSDDLQLVVGVMLEF